MMSNAKNEGIKVRYYVTSTTDKNLAKVVHATSAADAINQVANALEMEEGKVYSLHAESLSPRRSKNKMQSAPPQNKKTGK